MSGQEPRAAGENPAPGVNKNGGRAMNDYELIRILPDVKDDEAWQEVLDLAKEQVREGGKKLELVIGAARQSTDLLAERDELKRHFDNLVALLKQGPESWSYPLSDYLDSLPASGA